ncbi:DNA repair protein RAD51 homolog 4-like [Dendronephthya gigantea]|uniref:DNA repair protein RAD51 homolog 4-like n=1 Tax=Dendronephthya gigantea TaxID=151771 RepID=UPI00106AE8D7|nr:DNA repair protein RAD51 homolog 4-like [Dendronephthya gigantea]
MEFLANVVTADFSYKQCLSSLDVIPTGCSNLDNILGGGLYSGKLTEIYGLPGVGKTQSCLSIACHVAGTHQKNVVYIDCDASFSAQRIHEIFTTRYDSSSIMVSLTIRSTWLEYNVLKHLRSFMLSLFWKN